MSRGGKRENAGRKKAARQTYKQIQVTKELFNALKKIKKNKTWTSFLSTLDENQQKTVNLD